MSGKAKNQLLARFDELIVEGKALVASIEVIPPHRNGSVFITYTTYRWDPQRLSRWITNCVALFGPFAKPNTKLKEQMDIFAEASGEKSEVEHSLGILEAIRDNFAKGFLDDLLLKVEAEVSADYLGQAEALMEQSSAKSAEHIPAAVLAGAVLEKGLRTLCEHQDPPHPSFRCQR